MDFEGQTSEDQLTGDKPRRGGVEGKGKGASSQFLSFNEKKYMLFHLAILSSNVICKKKNLSENSQFRVAFFPYWVYTYIYMYT